MARKQITTPSTDSDGLLGLALDEVSRQIAGYNERRRVITLELAELYDAGQKTNTAEVVISEREKAVRARARDMLNGHAPEGLRATIPALSREADLHVERDAIDVILGLLHKAEIPAIAAAATRWVEAHRDEWRALVREILMTAVRLHALEEHARSLLAGIPGGSASGLVLTAFIGREYCLAQYPATLADARAAAIQQAIITDAEARQLEDVR